MKLMIKEALELEIRRILKNLCILLGIKQNFKNKNKIYTPNESLQTIKE